jgi:hypothetical protein
LQVAALVRSRSEVEKPILSLELRSGSGMVILRTSTPLELSSEGTAQVLYEVPDLRLLGGEYDLALGAADGVTTAGFDRTVHFSVAPEEGAEGVVDLRGGWRALDQAGELR